MIGGIKSREYSVALWTSSVFIFVSDVDGFLKIQLLEQPLIYFYFFDILKWLVLPVILMFFVHRNSNVLAREYGLVADLGIADLLIILPAPLIALLLVNFLVTGLAYALLGRPATPFSHQEVLEVLGPLWIVGTLYFSISAGLWESIFYIGLPWLWFSQARRMQQSHINLFYFVSSSLFAIAHWENGLYNVIGAFAFQAYAIWWYFRLKTLWPVIVAHALIDIYYFWPA